MARTEFNVLQLAVLISNGYRYFLFTEGAESEAKDPLQILIKVIPFQKLQDAKAVLSLFGEKAYMLKSLIDYQLLFDIAQGVSGVKYIISNLIDINKMEIKKAFEMKN